MGLSIHIESFGETIVQRDMLRFGENVTDMRPAMRESGDIMRGAIRQQFATEGTHSGGLKWERLSGSDGSRTRQGSDFLNAYGFGGGIQGARTLERESVLTGYALWKHTHFPGMPILQATRRLYRSLVEREGDEHVERVSADSLRFGSLVRYGIYHQSSKPRTKIPFRPPVGLSEGDKRAIVSAIQRRAMEGLR